MGGGGLLSLGADGERRANNRFSFLGSQSDGNNSDRLSRYGTGFIRMGRWPSRAPSEWGDGGHGYWVGTDADIDDNGNLISLNGVRLPSGAERRVTDS